MQGSLKGVINLDILFGSQTGVEDGCPTISETQPPNAGGDPIYSRVTMVVVGRLGPATQRAGHLRSQ